VDLMNDARELVVARYVAMDTQAQRVFLVKLACQLTLVGRDTYDTFGAVNDPVRLRAVNEAQHRVLSQLLKLLTGDERRYPDEVFANIVVDQLQASKLDPEGILPWN
jgi:hypothetical protein